MHYQKCFLEVRIKELDILDCVYICIWFFGLGKNNRGQYITESKQI